MCVGPALAILLTYSSLHPQRYLFPFHIFIPYICIYMYFKIILVWLCQVSLVGCGISFPDPGLNPGPQHWECIVFSNELTRCMRWPKYWSFSFSISPSKKSQGSPSSEWTGWISLQFKGLSRVFSNTAVQNHQFFGAQLSSQFNSHIHT